MNKIKLLDCTLRDGGSLNNWDFGYENIVNIIQYLNDSNIEIIEIGFLQDNVKPTLNKTISNSTDVFDKMLCKINNKKFKAAAMINLCKFNINLLKNKNETLIDEIRLMFKKQDLKQAIDTAVKIKEKGYSLSLNPVSVTSYNKAELITLIKTANMINPEIIYIVDTYGLMDGKETVEIFNIFNNELNQTIQIGYHSHNNLQLAFANSIEIITNSANRNIVADGSLLGMGKRAGNTNTELLASYINKKYNSHYNINKLNDIIEFAIIPLHKNFEWGYSMTHYIAAINRCHSDYVNYLKNTKNLSYSKIN
ncbi:MAG: aldolase catalytic domain-containing protein, partial [Candidatus Gastranaerophilales bacterium]|nr:aldolase catalytic domain-containing protein [Candidatus Gastranaerophilales bacterium]